MIRLYGLGKFDTILDSYVYDVSMDGTDEECGSVSEYGEWYGIMRNGKTIFRDGDPMLEQLTTEEREQLESSAGVILYEGSNGFVSVTYYDTEDALDGAWSDILNDFESLDSEQDSLWEEKHGND